MTQTESKPSSSACRAWWVSSLRRAGWPLTRSYSCRATPMCTEAVYGAVLARRIEERLGGSGDEWGRREGGETSRQLSARTDPEFPVGTRQVDLDRPGAQKETFGHFPGGGPRGCEQRHLQLLGCQFLDGAEVPSAHGGAAGLQLLDGSCC